jgi:hypothetical protein
MDLYTGWCRNRNKHAHQYAYSTNSRIESDSGLGESLMATSPKVQYNSRALRDITNAMPESADVTLSLLKPVFRSGYHVPGCMEGTRESVFKEIMAWLNGASITISVVHEYQ